MGKQFRNPFSPLVAYIDLTLIEPVKTVAAVFGRKSRAITGKRRSAPAAADKNSSGMPPLLMNHRKFQTRQSARLRAKEQEAIQALIDRMNGRQASTLSAFRPVTQFPALAAHSKNEDGTPESTNGRAALYLIKR